MQTKDKSLSQHIYIYYKKLSTFTIQKEKKSKTKKVMKQTLVRRIVQKKILLTILFRLFEILKNSLYIYSYVINKIVNEFF